MRPNLLLDFLLFRRMITLGLIQLLFWCGMAASVTVGISILREEPLLGVSFAALLPVDSAVMGLIVLIGGPIVLRILCEILILFFRMNETLTDIRQALQPPKPARKS